MRAPADASISRRTRQNMSSVSSDLIDAGVLVSAPQSSFVERAKIAVISLILVVLSFHTLADTNWSSFTKIGGGTYAETSSEHFAIFKLVNDQYVIRQVVSVDKKGHHLHTFA